MGEMFFSFGRGPVRSAGVCRNVYTILNSRRNRNDSGRLRRTNRLVHYGERENLPAISSQSAHLSKSAKGAAASVVVVLEEKNQRLASPLLQD